MLKRWSQRRTTQETARGEIVRDSIYLSVTSLTHQIVMWEYAHPGLLPLKVHSLQESGQPSVSIHQKFTTLDCMVWPPCYQGKSYCTSGAGRSRELEMEKKPVGVCVCVCVCVWWGGRWRWAWHEGEWAFIIPPKRNSPFISIFDCHSSQLAEVGFSLSYFQVGKDPDARKN